MSRRRVRRHDLVVLGGGTAGMTAAVTGAGLGARVLLVEADRTGGDCLWTGCVPSKALLASARRAHDVRTAPEVGLPPVSVEVDLGRVMDHVRSAIAAIAPDDSPERLRAAGVEVVRGTARFAAPGRIAVDGRTVRYRAAVIATGSRPAVPDVAGIDGADPLTSDTVWGLRDLPERLLVLGGGPTGCELGQAFARLGSRVILVESADRLLPAVDGAAAAVVTAALRREDVDVRTGTRPVRLAGGTATLAGPHGTTDVGYDRVLVATGRTPRTTDLGLERVGVRRRADGHVAVDRTLRTTGRNVLAAGDVTGLMPTTHVAGSHGVVAAVNALLRLRRPVGTSRVPWTVFTDPEVAGVGVTAAAARDRWGGRAVVVRHDQAHVDRAVTDARTDGFATLVAGPDGRLVGATIVGAGAGEAIAEVVAWLHGGARVRDVAGAVHAYPTRTEAVWWAALDHTRERYLSPSVRRWTRPLLAALRAVDVPR